MAKAFDVDAFLALPDEAVFSDAALRRRDGEFDVDAFLALPDEAVRMPTAEERAAAGPRGPQRSVRRPYALTGGTGAAEGLPAAAAPAGPEWTPLAADPNASAGAAGAVLLERQARAAAAEAAAAQRQREEEFETVARAMPPEVARQLAQRVYPLGEAREAIPDEALLRMGKIGWWESVVRAVDDGSWRYRMPMTGDLMAGADVANLVVRWQRLRAAKYPQTYLGEAQRRQDEQAVRNWALWTHEEEARGRSGIAQIAGGIAESAKFVVEFALTAGTKQAAKAAGKEMTAALVRRELGEAARWGLKGMGLLAREAVPQAARLAPLKLPRLTAEQMRPEGVEIDPETGRIAARGEGRPLAKAAVIAALQHVGMVGVESAGGVLIDPFVEAGKVAATGVARGAAEKLPAGAREVAERFAGALKGAAEKAKVPPGRVAELLRAGDFGGLAGELGEERLEDAWNVAVSAIPGLDADLARPEDIVYGPRGERLRNFAVELGVIVGLKGLAAGAGRVLDGKGRGPAPAARDGEETVPPAEPTGAAVPPPERAAGATGTPAVVSAAGTEDAQATPPPAAVEGEPEPTPAEGVRRPAPVRRPPPVEPEPATTPLIDWLVENGGIRPKVRTDAPGGEYDGQPEPVALKPFGSRLLPRDGTGLAPDEAAAMARERGLLPDAYPDTLWNRIAGEVAAWNRTERERRAARFEIEQAERFEREVVQGSGGSAAVEVDSLRLGDTVVARGQRLSVVHIDPDSGDVALSRSDRYGDAWLDAGTEIRPEAVERAAAAPAEEGDPFAEQTGQAPAAPGEDEDDGIAFGPDESGRVVTLPAGATPTATAPDIEPGATAEVPPPPERVQVVQVTGRELADPADIGTLRAAAIRHVAALQGKPLLNRHTGWTLTVGRKDREKLARDYGQGRADLQGLAALQRLVEVAILDETHPDAKGRQEVTGVHRFYAPLRIGDRLHRVKLTAISYVENGRRLHALKAVEMESPAVITLPPGAVETAPAEPQPAGPPSITVAELMRGVKSGVRTAEAGGAAAAAPRGPAAERPWGLATLVPTAVSTPEEARAYVERLYAGGATTGAEAPGEASRAGTDTRDDGRAAAPRTYAEMPPLTVERLSGIVPGRRTEADHVEAGKARYGLPGQLEFDFAVSPGSGLSTEGADAVPEAGNGPVPAAGTADRPEGWTVLRSRVRDGRTRIGTFRLAHTRIDTARQAAEVLRDVRDGSQEKLILLPLDEANRVLPSGLILLHVGTIDAAPVDMRAVHRALRQCGCRRFILAHNHPSGDPSPSAADLQVHRQILDSLTASGEAVMVDGLILNGDRFYSIRGERTESYGMPAATRRVPVSLLGEFGAGAAPFDSGISAVTGEPGPREEVTGPVEAARAAAQAIGPGSSGRQPLVLLGLDTRHHVAAAAVIPPEYVDAQQAVITMARLNGLQKVLAVWERPEGEGDWPQALLGKFRELQEAGRLHGIQLLDLVRMRPTGGAVVDSARTVGLMEAPAQYGAPGAVAEAPPGDDIPAGEAQPAAEKPVLALHELVELARQLMEGRLPRVVERLRIGGGSALGVFRGDPEGAEIALRADLFVGPQVAAVILPRNAEKARAAEEALLAALRARHPEVAEGDWVVRRRSLRGGVLLSVYRRDHDYVLRTLAHEIGHLADWLDDRTLTRGNILGHIAALKRFMGRMIQGTPENPHELISKGERNTLRRQAYQSVRATTTLDPRRQAEAFRGAVNKRYRELVAEAARARGLVTRDEVVTELKALSQWWKPFDEKADPRYTAYRYSPEELYADAFSAMLNAPGGFESKAPRFAAMWKAYLSARPGMAAHWNAVQGRLLGETGEDSIAVLMRRQHEGYRRGDEAYRRRYERERLSLADVRLFAETAVSSRAAAALAAERRLLKQTGAAVAPEALPSRALERMRYSASAAEGYARTVYEGVIAPLRHAGVALELFDDYLLARRVQGDRADLANPLGLRPESADAVLERLRGLVGDEGMARMEEAAGRLADVREQWVIGPLERSGAYGPDIIRTMRDNRAYVRFDVVDYLDRTHGKGTGLKIHAQLGTLREIASPLAATMGRDMGMIAATRRNEAKRTMVRFLQQFDPGAAAEADTRWVNTHMEALPPPDPDRQGQIAFLEDGHLQTWNVDRGIAAAFEGFDVSWYSKAVPLATAVGDVFRTLFIHVRPGYMLYNLIKDTMRTVVNAPGAATLWRIPANQARAIRLLWQTAHGETPPIIAEMLAAGELVSKADRRDLAELDRQTDRLLHQFGLETEQHAAAPGWVKLLRALRYGVETGNEIVERMTKVAGELYLREQHPQMSAAEREHRVRTQIGSPDFLERGAVSWVTNNLVLFSNAAVQGWKSDIEAMRGDGGVVAKRLALFLPYKAATMALRLGIAYGLWKLLRPDDDEEKGGLAAALAESQAVFTSIPDHDLANYHCIPLGVDRETRQVLYLRLPLDETSRMMNGVVHYAVNRAAGEAGAVDWRNIVRIFADQLPSMNPVFEIGAAALDMMRGQNPVDSWTGREVVDPMVYAARATPEANAWKQWGQWAWQKGGLGILYNTVPEWKRDVPRAEGAAGVVQTIDTTPALAVVDDIVGRFLKVSDYGRYQRQKVEAQDAMTVERARLSVVKLDLARRLAAGDPIENPTPYEAQVLGNHRDEVLERLQELRRSRGLPADIRAILDAPKADRARLWRWQAENPRP